MHLPPGEVRNRDTSRAPRLDLGVIDTKSSPGRLPCYDQSDSQFILCVTSSAVPHQSGHPPLTPSDSRFRESKIREFDQGMVSTRHVLIVHEVWSYTFGSSFLTVLNGFGFYPWFRSSVLVSPPVCPGFTFGLHSPSVLVSINVCSRFRDGFWGRLCAQSWHSSVLSAFMVFSCSCSESCTLLSPGGGGRTFR